MLDKLLNLLFPQSCPVCQKPSSNHKIAPICNECWHSILPYKGPLCRRCGIPLSSDVSKICAECIKEYPAFINARSFGSYNGALRTAINLFKYHGVKRLAKPLSDIISQLKIPRVDTVVPVPLYNKRLRQREFNQSALLAKNMARYLGVPLMLSCLVKARDTLPQVGLNSKQRRKNIRKAFKIRDRRLIKGKKILLVDDVITTGATIRECAGELKKAGAEDIYAIALAHGTRD